MSLREAINKRCKQCIYDPYDRGTWREQVAACTSPDCALFAVRPGPTTRKMDPSTPCSRKQPKRPQNGWEKLEATEA